MSNPAIEITEPAADGYRTVRAGADSDRFRTVAACERWLARHGFAPDGAVIPAIGDDDDLFVSANGCTPAEHEARLAREKRDAIAFARTLPRLVTTYRR